MDAWKSPDRQRSHRNMLVSGNPGGLKAIDTDPTLSGTLATPSTRQSIGAASGAFPSTSVDLYLLKAPSRNGKRNRQQSVVAEERVQTHQMLAGIC